LTLRLTDRAFRDIACASSVPEHAHFLY